MEWILFLAILILWLQSAFFDFASFLYIWQLKEYRLDRMREHLSTPEGKIWLCTYKILWRPILILLILVFFGFFYGYVASYTVLLLIDLAGNIRNFYKKNFFLPVLTKKIILLITVAFLIETIVFFYFSDRTFVFGALLWLLLLRFIIISLLVGIFWIPTRLIKNWYCKRAKAKIKSMPELMVIGITGSYGKSSVKSFLATILQGFHKVIVTPKNINTDIGVAKFILSSDLSKYNILIVEMGAYKVGEICKIANMVEPIIGVLTAINEQHMSLFGSMEKTRDAKYELLRSIPKNGLIITNSDDALCRSKLNELNAVVQTFGFDTKYNPTCLISSVQSTLNQLSATYTIGNDTVSIQAPVPGQHNASNIAPCLLVASFLHTPMPIFLDQCRKLSTPAGVLKTIPFGRATIIDDSYNTNPVAFKAALNFLSQFPPKKKKIVITRGMLELGNKSRELHEQLGREIALIVDELVIIKPDFIDDLQKGMGKSHIKIITAYTASELLTYVQSLKETDSIILVESRIPHSVYSTCITQNP